MAETNPQIEESKQPESEKEEQARLRLIESSKKFISSDKFWYLLFFFILLFGIYVRTQNLWLLQDENPLELDPYYFLRMAKTLVETGSLPEIDTMRNYPLGIEPARENLFVVHTIKYIYSFIKIFSPSITVEKSAILYPAIFFPLLLILFFLFVREIFNIKIATLASLYLVILPPFLYRTMAGFADKEPLGLFFMFLTFLLYIESWKIKKIQYSLIFALLSGVTTGFMGLSWGGFQFLVVTIVLANGILYLFNSIHKKEKSIYLLWAFLTTTILILFTPRYGGLTGLLLQPTTLIMFLMAGIFILEFILNHINFIKKIDIPASIKTTISSIIFGLVLFPIVTIAFPSKINISQILYQAKLLLTKGFSTSRLMTTVAEAKQPYFVDFTQSFGLYFYLFLIGLVLFFYFTIKNIEKIKIKSTILFVIFLFGLLYSRYSPYSALNGTSLIANIIFFASFIIIGILIIVPIISFLRKKNDTYIKLKNIKKEHLFLIVWCVVMLLGARGAIRLLFTLAPVSAVFVSFLFFKSINLSRSIKDKTYKYVSYFLIFIIFIPQIYSLSTTILLQAKYTGPSFNQQWQESMHWVRTETNQEEVFAHWWDYGYWVQTKGQRPTITDGGNYIPYWNHLMGRHVLSARSYDEALQFLYTHNASYLLIISDEIGKYSAYSSIGSDENYDIFSWIGTYIMDRTSTRKEGDLVTYYFIGGTALDDDIEYEGKIFSKKITSIAYFEIPVNESDEDNIQILQPKANLFYQGSRTEIPVECVFDEKQKKHFTEPGLKGCLRIFPYYINQQYQIEKGSLLYVSEKGLNALWTKLFLFDETSPYFELVYDDSGKHSLAYYRGNILGPLKIWKIQYPEKFTVDQKLREEYLSITTPEWMELDKKSAWDEV